MGMYMELTTWRGLSQSWLRALQSFSSIWEKSAKAHSWGEWVQAEPIKLISDKFATHHHNLKCFRDGIKDQRTEGTSLMTKMYDMERWKKQKWQSACIADIFWWTKKKPCKARQRCIDTSRCKNRKEGIQPSSICSCSVIQIDRFINNESRKTGKINSVNKCAVSSSAPLSNGLCLCTSLLLQFILMHVCFSVYTLI